MHAHKDEGTSQEPRHKHAKIHNGVRQAKKQTTACKQAQGKAENAEVQSFTLMV